MNVGFNKHALPTRSQVTYRDMYLSKKLIRFKFGFWLILVNYSPIP
jgi:hypothetical protein